MTEFIRNSEFNDRAYLDAFMKTAQYLAGLTTHEDVWNHIAELMVKFYGADSAGFARQLENGEIEFHNLMPTDRSCRAFPESQEFRESVREVLQTGFLALRTLTAFEGPYTVVLLPIVAGAETADVMFVGHVTAGPISKEILNVYLAVAGLAGTTVNKLFSEAELKKHRAHLEKLVFERTKELESFSYSASHDLRAPLRAIIGFTRKILDEKGTSFDSETTRMFGVIRDNAQRMGQLIDDLLRLSRLGRTELNWSKLSMEGLVKEVLAEIRSADPEREFEAEIGELPEAYGDRAMIRQVLLNLLANAVKFSRGKQDARIEVGSNKSPGEQVYYVRDNGAGFNMKYYNKLFGVFQRLVSESQFEGTGVGLAIVERVIQRHGGRVWAEGEINKGATFYFTLSPKEQQ
ncbi:putative Histidine kinase [Syntrophobacter sp. SbD1]|nr:putative Histidine kinase [Syntrophobacter sp. SbD1]